MGNIEDAEPAIEGINRQGNVTISLTNTPQSTLSQDQNCKQTEESLYYPARIEGAVTWPSQHCYYAQPSRQRMFQHGTQEEA